MRSYTASPGRYTNTGRRAVGSTVQLDFLGDDFLCFRISAQCLVPPWIHVCVSLPASCIWQSLVRCRSSLRSSFVGFSGTRGCGPGFLPSLCRRNGSSGTPRHRLLCAHGADSRRSCAADGGTAARHTPVLRQAHDCSRAGYRSAQDSS